MKFEILIAGWKSYFFACCRAIKSLNHPTTGNIRCDKFHQNWIKNLKICCPQNIQLQGEKGFLKKGGMILWGKIHPWLLNERGWSPKLYSITPYIWKWYNNIKSDQINESINRSITSKSGGTPDFSHPLKYVTNRRCGSNL